MTVSFNGITLAVSNYQYPGQSGLWVFTYIFSGWMAVCGTRLLIAEGIRARRGEDLTVPRLRWQALLVWIEIARHPRWGLGLSTAAAIGALPVLGKP